MDRFQQLDNAKKPLCRVELHIHLQGSIRYETMWELLRKKKLPMPGDGSLQALKEAVIVHQPGTLASYLAGFQVYYPAFIGDLEAIERVGYEFVEDRYHQRVLYVEGRFPPHELLDPKKPEVTVRDVVRAVNRGFRRAEAKFPGIKARLILCCYRTRPEWAPEVAQLCVEFKDEGVVGIDISGDEASCIDSDGNPVLHPLEIAAYEEVRAKGLHRTAHAGEAGPASMVWESVTKLHAERIGHGYHTVDDPEIYKKCQEKNIHFETCPSSSMCTGSVPLSYAHHPILRFIEDKVNYSISTDDSTITNSQLPQEYEVARRWGLDEAELARANFNAARCAFLPEGEKRELIKTLERAYGIS